MSHVHGLKKPTEAKAGKADKAEVQGTSRGPSAQGPFARHIGHLRGTNGSTVWQGRCLAPRLKRQFVRKYPNKFVVTSGSMFFFGGCYGNGKYMQISDGIWSKESSVWLASPQYANTDQYISSLFAEFPIHTATSYSWWFPRLWWRATRS